MASCMPGSPEVHSRCFPVILHEVYFKISSLHLLVVCVRMRMHACAFIPQHTHGGQTQLVESHLFLPWVSRMEFRSQTLMASILTSRIISPVPQYIETAFLTEPELTNLIRPSCPVNSRDPVSASSSYWN